MSISKTVRSHEYDVVIIGSGPAGLTTAMKIAEQLPLKIAIIESGGLSPNSRAQNLSSVRASGSLSSGYFKVHSQRCFGGTSNIWAGYCAVLEERAFAAGEWPIEFAELASYYPEAAEILEIPEAAFREPLRPLDAAENLIYKPFFITQPVRFRNKYRAYFDAHANIEVLLNKTVVELVETQGRIASVVIRDSAKPELPAIEIQAATVVVACGGLGNPRLLQLSSIASESPVGNYFMCHPYAKVTAKSLIIQLDKERVEKFVYPGSQLRHALQLSSEFCVGQKLRSMSIGFFMKQVVDRPLLAGNQPCFDERIYLMTEMPSAKENRTYLGKGQDYLGQAKSHVEFKFPNHRLTERAWKAFARELLASGLGRAAVAPKDFGFHNGGGHHMGTTRMGRDPVESVVDRDCKVHSLDNLYLAGSSIFPAGGVANPTFSIVAFALRLAEHIVGIHRGST